MCETANPTNFYRTISSPLSSLLEAFQQTPRRRLESSRPVNVMAASTVRALGVLFLHKVSLSNGHARLFSSFAAIHGPSALNRIGFLGMRSSSVQRARRISTTMPVCMGRRSCKIAGRKDAQNLKKMKRNSKIGKEIVSAIKKGGANPTSNTLLAAILDKARELDVPREIVDQNIKKATEKGQEDFIEKFYEVYGFGGVGMVVAVSTDKITRSIADVRGVVKDCGAKLADPGSILFKFRRARVVNVKVTDADKDQILSVALDAGAEDVIEPTIYDDDSEEDQAESYYKITTTAENYSVVLLKLRDEGIAFEPDNGFELLPLNAIEVDDEAMDLNKELVSKFLELEDVDAVYTDQK